MTSAGQTPDDFEVILWGDRTHSGFLNVSQSSRLDISSAIPIKQPQNISSLPLQLHCCSFHLRLLANTLGTMLSFFLLTLVRTYIVVFSVFMAMPNGCLATLQPVEAQVSPCTLSLPSFAATQCPPASTAYASTSTALVPILCGDCDLEVQVQSHSCSDVVRPLLYQSFRNSLWLFTGNGLYHHCHVGHLRSFDLLMPSIGSFGKLYFCCGCFKHLDVSLEPDWNRYQSLQAHHYPDYRSHSDRHPDRAGSHEGRQTPSMEGPTRLTKPYPC